MIDKHSFEGEATEVVKGDGLTVDPANVGHRKDVANRVLRRR